MPSASDKVTSYHLEGSKLMEYIFIGKWIKKMGGGMEELLPSFQPLFAFSVSSIIENIYKELVNPFQC